MRLFREVPTLDSKGFYQILRNPYSALRLHCALNQQTHINGQLNIYLYIYIYIYIYIHIMGILLSKSPTSPWWPTALTLGQPHPTTRPSRPPDRRTWKKPPETSNVAAETSELLPFTSDPWKNRWKKRRKTTSCLLQTQGTQRVFQWKAKKNNNYPVKLQW